MIDDCYQYVCFFAFNYYFFAVMYFLLSSNLWYIKVCTAQRVVCISHERVYSDDLWRNARFVFSTSVVSLKFEDAHVYSAIQLLT